MVALGICEGRLGVHKSSSHYFRNCISCNTAIPAVVGLEPTGKLFRTFARVACETTPGNVFTINYSRVVHNVFPGCGGLSVMFKQSEFNATVNATCVTILDLTLQPVRNVPSIHVPERTHKAV